MLQLHSSRPWIPTRNSGSGSSSSKRNSRPYSCGWIPISTFHVDIMLIDNRSKWKMSSRMTWRKLDPTLQVSISSKVNSSLSKMDSKNSSQEKSELYKIKKWDFIKRNPHTNFVKIGVNFGGRSSTSLFAGLSEVEPDLNEDPKDRWATNGIDAEDFQYGKYDGHHTYYESDDKPSFWESVAEDYAAIGPPTGFQGLISWLFLPAVAAGIYFNVPGEYLYGGAALFTVVFCIIEMDKPSEPHNFEPQIYNMERGARDKLISDYNTMDIWDFNEKYGDLWDFTVKKDDIMKR